MKNIIYTCITAGYDSVKDPEVITPGWDYICFSDSEIKSDVWQHKPLASPRNISKVKKARWHKTHPFELFPEAELIIWIDGSFVIKCDLDDFFDRRGDISSGIAAIKHSQRNCIYQEQAAVHRLKKDLPGNTIQIDRYRKEGMPENYGLSETGILIYRCNNCVQDFTMKWWEEIRRGSHRDQLSFDYVRWSTDYHIHHFTANAKKIDFLLTKHPKKLLFSDQKNGFDVVYVLGSGSEWNDNEIRYSIRSFVKYFADLRNIVIVGQMPVWAKNVIHIPWPDNPDYNTDQRLIDKLIQACKDRRVSNRFLFCSDDKLLLDNCQMSDFNGGHFGDITEVEKPSDWQNIVYATKAELIKRGLPYKDYNKPHAIQPIDKREYLRVMAKWDWDKKEYTGCNIYQNSSEIFKGELIRKSHLRLKALVNHAKLILALDGMKSMNYTAKALNIVVQETLDVLLPERTIYEIYGIRGTAWDEYQSWLANKQPFEMGINLLIKYTRNGRLIKYFQKKQESPVTKKQLAHNLAIVSRKWS